MIRFIMVGGFLGAGKTTAIANLASHYMRQGLRVGIVTNDQAYDLVDTRSLRAQGFHVGEVPGACFCCKFNDLVETVSRLTQDNRPEVVITEPVGSCTDLVATVIEPLRMMHGDSYEIAPLVVLLKPEHGRKILGEEKGSGFSPRAAYIFLKQVEEADVVAINKVDKLTPSQREQLRDLVERRYPGKRILLTSSRTNEGFSDLVDALETMRGTASSTMMEVDYDVYAAGEAELGWLNCVAEVSAIAGSLELDVLVRNLVERIAARLDHLGAQAAHLKVLGEAGDASALANLVDSDVAVELSVISRARVPRASLVVNARVVCDPLLLEEIVVEAFRGLAAELSLDIELGDIQRFRPGRPVPTHRVTSS